MQKNAILINLFFRDPSSLFSGYLKLFRVSVVNVWA